jgi:hypothetical protein
VRSVAILLYKPSYSLYERLNAFWTHKGIAIAQTDYVSATDSAGGNYAFSNTWRDIEILGYRSSGIDLTSYNRASTGSLWNNVYVRNGPTGPAEDASSFPVIIRNSDEQVFNQLNIESVNCVSSDALLIHGSSAVINGLHLEGIALSHLDGSLVQAYDVGNTLINMMTVQGTTFAANRNNKSIVKVGLGARVRVQGLTLRNNNKIQSAVLALMHSLDQTGTFVATEADLSYFTALTVGDTGATPVAKQVNDMTDFAPLGRPVAP